MSVLITVFSPIIIIIRASVSRSGCVNLSATRNAHYILWHTTRWRLIPESEAYTVHSNCATANTDFFF